MGCQLFVDEGKFAVPFINDVVANNQRIMEKQRSSTTLQEKTGFSQYQFDPDVISTFLKSRIAGQGQVIEFLTRQLKVIKAGLAPRERPLLVALFIGSTGVGKTEIVRLLSRCIWGRTDAFCRIDMNTLSQSHYSAAIAGAPPGYVGSKEGATLFDEEAISGSYGRPGIVLFDEIEKASPEVTRSLMNVFDRGELSLASGNKKLLFTNSLVFMTSNLGFNEATNNLRNPAKMRPLKFFQKYWRPGPDCKVIIDRALHQHFDTEFLNRIDHIAHFQTLSPDAMGSIVDLELDDLNRTLLQHNLRCSLEPGARKMLAEKGFDPEFGARALKRIFREWVIEPLADYLLTDMEGSGVTVLVGAVQDQQIVFSPAAPNSNSQLSKPDTSLTPEEMTL